MKVKCSTEWFYETTSEEEMKRNFAIQRKKGRRSVSYQDSKVPLIFNSSLSIQMHIFFTITVKSQVLTSLI